MSKSHRTSHGSSHGGHNKDPSSQSSQTTEMLSESNQDAQNDGHVLNWFKGAGQWIADKYEDTTQAIGDFAHRTGQSANELVEAISSTDISFEDGMNIRTDLDEVMDVLDPILGDLIAFDREKSDNEVQLKVEKDGSIRIQTSSIALKSMQFDEYQMGSGEIQGVDIYVKQDRDSWIPGVELEKSNVQVNIQKVIGRDIRYLSGDSSAVLASEVELEGFSATSIGEKSPFDDQNKGSIQFNVANAKVRGFDGMGSSVGSLELGSTKGNFGPTGGNLSIRSADAQNYQSDGVVVQSTNLQGVQGSIQQSGENFQSSVGASKVDVQGVNALGNSVDAVALSGVALSGQGKNLSSLNSASTSIDQMQVSGVDSDYVSGTSLSGSQISGSVTGSMSSDGVNLNTLSATSGSMQATGVNSQFINAENINTAGLGYSLSKDGRNTISTNDISMQNASTDFLSGSSLSATNMAVGFSSKEQRPVTISSAELSGNNLSSDFGSANNLSTKDLNVSIGDSISASSSNIEASDIKASGASVDQLSIKDVNAQGNLATMTGSANVGLANIQGASHSGSSVQSATINNLSASSDASEISASIQDASVSDVQSQGVVVDSASVKNLQGQGNLTTMTGSANVGHANIQGASHSGSSVQSATINNLSASSDASGISASIQDASVSDVQSQGVVVDSASVKNLQGQGNLTTMTGSTSVDQVHVGSAHHGLGNVKDVTLNGVSASATKDSYQADIGNIQGNKINAGGTNINDVNIQTLSGNVSRDLQSGSATLGSVGTSGIQGSTLAKGKNINYSAGGTSLNNLDVGFSTQNGNISAQGSFANVQAKDLHMDGVASVGDLAVDNVRANHASDGSSLQIGSVDAKNVEEHLMGGKAGNISGSQISVSALDPTHYDASFGKVQAGDVQWKDSSLGSLDLNQTNANIRDGFVNASVNSANLTDARFQNDQISSYAQSGSLEGIRFTGEKDNIAGDVVSGNLQNVSTNVADNNINISDIGFQGVNTKNNAEGLSLNLKQAEAANVGIHNNFASAGIQNANITGASLQTTANGLKFGGEKASVGGVDYAVDLSKAPQSDGSSSMIDSNKLIGTAAQRIDNAHIKASVGLNAGDYGDQGIPAVIKNDTRAHADLRIENNRIQNGSRVNLNNDLDTPLWTSVGGAYVKDNRMMADVNGWFDVNAGKSINKSLGLEGKDLHSLGTYGEKIASKTPSNESSSDGPNLVDISQLQASGSVGLSDGQIDAGAAQVTLDQSQDGDNVAHFEATPESISAHFARFVASALSFNMGGTEASSKNAAVSGGTVTIMPDSQIATGGIQAVTVESIKGKM